MPKRSPSDGHTLAPADDSGRILLAPAASLTDPKATVRAIRALGRPGLTQEPRKTYMPGTSYRPACC
ncbi:hypothetical protein OG723_00215 [Streptomyces sp. NBC_01278]|uniref:hypothetical protein n=1 Tax=Streptomyces sp. NBC_01278 TaxID=2903809 RepID=UPI002E353353|nr:hypothetical protein [Streptomyces sp. NBC_01278]